VFSFEELKATLPDLNYEPVDVNGTPGALVAREKIQEVARALKEKHGFLQMIDGLGVDRNERKMRFEMIYNLRNHKTNERVFLKVRCDERDPHVPSLVSVWTGANWHEREAFDMYGIVFDGHPDMRRMYMPEDFKYYPLRKDFPLLGVPGSIPLPRTDGAEERFKLPDRGE
jgi:NADH-quinone oxidoreductase subunit C